MSAAPPEDKSAMAPASPSPGADGAGGRQGLKLALEVGPLLVFFVVNAMAGLIVGTAAFVVATTASLVASRVLLRRIPMMPLIAGGFVIVFGGLTVLLDDDLFIKIKPTIVNLLFAALLAGGLVTGRHLLKLVFDGAFHLTERGWRLLSVRWMLFFLVLAALNEIMWRGFSSDTWVAFKVFGILPLTIVFSLSQIPLMLRHRADPDAATPCAVEPPAARRTESGQTSGRGGQPPAV